MKLTSVFSINFKKLKHRTGKALFLIVPITILVALGLIISSQTNNIQKALDKYVFSKIKDQDTVLQVNYQTSQDDFFNPGSGNKNSINMQTGFTESDLSKISDISNVTDSAIIYTVPITNAVTTDLISGSTLKFSNISTLKDSMAAIYTTDNFTYTEGEAIPIIVNPNTFIESYEDWGGQTTISVDFRAGRPSNSTSATTGTTPAQPQMGPIKSKAVEYNKDELIGKTFTIKFGGFQDIQDFKLTRENGTTTFTKLTSDEIATQVNDRKTAVNKYWNYDKLAAGQTYTFKVVGVIEKEGNTSMYIPESFAQVLMKQYVQNQISAQNGTTIPTSVLSSTYTGLTYDGTELTSQSGFSGRGGFGGGFQMGGPRPGETNTTQTTYAIPGLVIKVAESDSSTIEGMVTDTEVFNSSVKRGDSITVKIDSLFSRSNVVSALNKLGYAYQDINDLDALNNIQKTLNSVSSGLIVAFTILTVAVIVLTMSKFVSESTKEIGIFRAVGFKKIDILLIFLFQSIIYTLIGYGVGLGIGVLGNMLASGFVANWFEHFAKTTINQTVAVTESINHGMFSNLNFESMILLSGILIGLTLVISFIPAFKASSISPVEAIKSE